MSLTSHPEDAEARLRRGSVGAADRDRPSTVRVSAGSMTPSSQSGRWRSKDALLLVLGADRRAEFVFLLGTTPPPASMLSRRSWLSTVAACSPPMTEMRAFGHMNRKRGE
jgi:hypothetical protein